jgi:hypothetical protein
MFESRRSLLRTLERERNAHTAQIDRLLETQQRLVDQLCVVAGKPSAAPELTEEWLTRLDHARRARTQYVEELEDDLVDPEQLP